MGEVEEGVGMLTVEAIELWWPNARDRRGVLSSVQKEGKWRGTGLLRADLGWVSAQKEGALFFVFLN